MPSPSWLLLLLVCGLSQSVRTQTGGIGFAPPTAELQSPQVEYLSESSSTNARIFLQEHADSGGVLAMINYDGTGTPESVSTSQLQEEYIEYGSGTWYINATRGVDCDPPNDVASILIQVRIGNEFRGSLNINIQNINDNKPIVTPKSATPCTFLENWNGTTNCTLTVKDIDKNFTTITYSTNDEEIFSIRKNTDSIIVGGDTMEIILLVNKNLDFETMPIYSIIITANDTADGNTWMFSLDYLVQLMDGPDQLPMWIEIFSAKSISEENPESFQLKAVDGDRTLNYEINYKFETAPIINGFEIDKTSGLLKIPSIDRDVEQIDVYRLTVIAYEKENISSFIKADIAILVNDINDNIPTLTAINTALTLLEETAQTFDGITVKDPDLASNGTFTVNIEKSHFSDAFLIIPNSGYQEGVFTISVVNASALDYDLEQPFPEFPIITLTIVAAEKDDESRKTSIDVQITLQDVNDEIPKFVQEYNISRNENLVAGTEIVTVQATDRDDNDTIRYSINQRMMAVNEDTGVVTLTDDNAFDYERQSVMTVQVTAKDEANHTAFADIIINIQDLDDEPPTLYMPNRPEIEEHISGVIEEIRASDPDKDAHLEFSIKWESSSATKQGAPVSDKSKYERCLDIKSQEPSGTDWVADLIVSDTYRLDWEVFDTLYVVIVVNDTATSPGYKHNEARNATLSISINDKNDCAPTFDESNETNLTVAENPSQGQLIGRVIATDLDGVGNNNITYGIAGSDVSSGMVVIDSRTGELRVGKEPPIDYEVNEIHNYNVSAYDEKHTSYAMITIYILDVNDNAPYELPFDKTPSIRENSNNTDFITQVKAKDNDTSAPFNTLSYILDNFDEYFYLNRSTGELFVNKDNTKLLDREDKESFEIRIIIRDNYEDGLIANSFPTPTTITLTVEDENDNRPVFQDFGPCMGRTLYETLAENGDVFTGILATDKDKGKNAEVIYSIESTDCVKCYDSKRSTVYDDYFRIETTASNTANIYANRMMTDLWGEYNIQVKAQDQGEELKNEVLQNYTVCIIDLNNNSPVFVEPKEDQTIFIKYAQKEESRLEGTNSFIEDFYATDKDDPDLNNGKVEFEVVGDETAKKYFGMNSFEGNTGYLKLHHMFDTDFPVDGRFKLTISAKDLGSPALATNVNINIRVFNTQDFPPYFKINEFEAAFTENTTGLKEYVTISTASDINNDNLEEGEPLQPIYYYIIEKDNDFFNLSKDTGRLSLLKPLDYELVTNHTFTVLASNFETPNGIITENSTLKVTIQVTDINDMPPRFVNSSFLGGFSTNEKSGKKVIQLEANDPDLNDKMVYSIVEGTMEASDPSISKFKDEAFNLDESTGVIELKFNPDSTHKGHFSFQVKVRDSFDGPDENHMDIASANVFIISDENRVLFKFKNPVNDVDNQRNEIQIVFSAVFKYSCGIETVSPASGENSVSLENVTDVLTHYVNETTGLPVDKVEITNKLSDRQVYLALTSAFLERKLFLDSYDAGDPGTEDMESYMQIILIAVSAVLATMVVMLFVAFFFRTRALNRRLEALSTTKFGSQESGLNRAGIAVPNTNQHAIEGSNPVWNEDEPEYDNMSQGSGDSDLIGIEDNPEFSPSGNNFSVNTNHFDTMGGADNGGFTMGSTPSFQPRSSINPLIGSGADSTLRRVSVNPLVASGGTGDPIEPSNNNFSFQNADPSDPQTSFSNSNFIFRKPDAMPVTQL